GGDTTGCGDTFVGGLVARLAEQMAAANTPATGRPRATARLSLDDAVRLGIASGAFCLTHLGGTWLEPRPGEKRARIAQLLERWGADAAP
ncbi:MAG: PfkB family carbohydrate kinase, partial [Spirochaetota bacterium]